MSRDVGTAEGKIAALKDAGVYVSNHADHPDQLAQMVIAG